MSASLVGSEMCIRDSSATLGSEPPAGAAGEAAAGPAALGAGVLSLATPSLIRAMSCSSPCRSAVRTS
eukprot:6355484-Alexandrium_andersonii.AAC.1